MTKLSGVLTLNDDVLMTPVAELEDESRDQFEHDPEDVAVSRLQARGGSKIIGADAADLVRLFREPRQIVEAVILYAREKQLEPDTVLEEAYPLLRSLVDSGVLVPADASDDGDGDRDGARDGERDGVEARRGIGGAASGGRRNGAASASRTHWKAGDRVLDAIVTRVGPVLDDTEIHFLQRPDGTRSVLKAERRNNASPLGGLLRERLAAEAAILERLARRRERPEAQSIAPALLGEGIADGRAYIELEYLAGTDAATAAAEWRERGDRAALLTLIRKIAHAYAALHARGVLHGDVHPRNVLVLADGSPRLIDFGFACVVASVANADGDVDADAASEILIDTAADLASGGALAAQLRPLPAAVAPRESGRGGVPFFYEPELARAYLAGVPPPPPTTAGEQHAVAALCYYLAAGAYWQDFRLDREGLLRDIVDRPPLALAARGVAPWLELDAVLGRALAKQPADRFADMQAFAAALDAVSAREALDALAAPAASDVPHAPQARAPRSAAIVARQPLLTSLVDRALASADLDGPWLRDGLSPAPTASINYGAAGIALGLLQIAQRRRDAHVLALADVWLRRAEQRMQHADAFHNAEIEITRDTVGDASSFHAPSGLHTVSALIARAVGNPGAQAEAIARFVAEAARPARGLDLTLGRSSTLLASAILLDALPRTALHTASSQKTLRRDARQAAAPPRASSQAAAVAGTHDEHDSDGAAAATGIDPQPLLAHGTAALAEIWTALDAKPAIAQADIDYPGIAHGWAGFLYATLLWCRVSGQPCPDAVERRLSELAALALPEGRGLEWPWVLPRGGVVATMPGWCNGSCGYVFLWTLAHRTFGAPAYLDLAHGAAWNSWESGEGGETLCCGLPGRAYALLDLHRLTHDANWLARARDLAWRAAKQEPARAEYPHSLYKGGFGLAVLAADLDAPDAAIMPCFQAMGYGASLR